MFTGKAGGFSQIVEEGEMPAQMKLEDAEKPTHRSSRPDGVRVPTVHPFTSCVDLGRPGAN